MEEEEEEEEEEDGVARLLYIRRGFSCRISGRVESI